MQNKEYISELKESICNGDGHSLGKLYEIYCKKLTSYGVNCSGKLDSSAIEDIVQEVFIWLAHNRKMLSNIEDLESYLFGAVKTNVIRAEKKLRKNHLLQSQFYSVEKKEKDGTELSSEHSLIQEEELSIIRDRVRIIMDSLPSAQKEVLFLRNYVNLSYCQISEVMNLSEQVVRNYAHRAIKKLRFDHSDMNKRDVL
jgi:RNA polymerase sigma factor (sigma-70 family)